MLGISFLFLTLGALVAVGRQKLLGREAMANLVVAEASS